MCQIVLQASLRPLIAPMIYSIILSPNIVARTATKAMAPIAQADSVEGIDRYGLISSITEIRITDRERSITPIRLVNISIFFISAEYICISERSDFLLIEEIIR